MRALVVYESMFGNTQTIAEAVAQGLSEHLHVVLVEVEDAPEQIDGDVGLVVVGGPTHAFGLSRPATREGAAGEAGERLVSRGQGLREWLAGLRGGASGVSAAAFDTHVDKRLPGSASQAAAKRLRRLGFRLIARPESFFVADKAGPLLVGEEERARRWAAALATQTERGRSVS